LLKTANRAVPNLDGLSLFDKIEKKRESYRLRNTVFGFLMHR